MRDGGSEIVICRYDILYYALEPLHTSQDYDDNKRPLTSNLDGALDSASASH